VQGQQPAPHLFLVAAELPSSSQPLLTASTSSLVSVSAAVLSCGSPLGLHSQGTVQHMPSLLRGAAGYKCSRWLAAVAPALRWLCLALRHVVLLAEDVVLVQRLRIVPAAAQAEASVVLVGRVPDLPDNPDTLQVNQSAVRGGYWW
jgi:hypothetical protein